MLIIKRLKTRSTAEVADTFNVSQRQVQRIRKRYEETGDVFDKPRSGRPHKTTARVDRLLASKIQGQPLFHWQQSSTRTWSPEASVSTGTVCQILSSKWPPWSNQCPETSTEQKTIKKPCGFCQGPQPAKRLKKTLEKWQKVNFSDESSVELHHSRRKYCRPIWSPHGSEIHPENSQVW